MKFAKGRPLPGGNPGIDIAIPSFGLRGKNFVSPDIMISQHPAETDDRAVRDAIARTITTFPEELRRSLMLRASPTQNVTRSFKPERIVRYSAAVMRLGLRFTPMTWQPNIEAR